MCVHDETGGLRKSKCRVCVYIRVLLCRGDVLEVPI